ncbi:MAG: hypothetical protein GY852_11325 [bacterium]|nr:hypothetical protein [bacterium]
MRFFALFTLLLFLFPLWAATGVNYEVQPPPFVNMDERSRAELNEMLLDVSAFYGGASLREIVSQRGFLVIGTDLSIPEREAMLAYANQNPIFSNFKKARDTESMELLRTDSFLVILGGPSQNDLAFYLEKEEMVKRTWNISDSMMARSGTTPGGGKFIILSDLRGYKNMRKEGIVSSPLAGFMPREYIPIASFLISILGLAAIPVIRIYLAGIFKTKERESGRKKVKEKFTGINLFGVPIRFREILSVFLGAFFYGMGVAYLYAGFTLELIPMGIASVIFVALLYYFRSLTRWFFDGRYKTHTEYVFWGTGGSLCWISSIFGFTLQTPGFEVEKIPEKFEKKAAFMKWAVLSVAMLVALTIFIINFFFPNEYLPVFQTVASAIAVTEILPFVPMPGVLIKKWNPWLWAVTFFTFIPIYFLINFYV